MSCQHVCLFSYEDRTVCRVHREQVVGDLIVGRRVQLKWPTSDDTYDIYSARILGLSENKQRGDKMVKEFSKKLGAKHLDKLDREGIDTILDTLTTDDKENKIPPEMSQNTKKRKAVTQSQPDAAQAIINTRAAAQQNTTQSFPILGASDRALNQFSPIALNNATHPPSQFCSDTSNVVSNAFHTLYDSVPNNEPLLQQLESSPPYVPPPVKSTAAVPTSLHYTQSQTQSSPLLQPPGHYIQPKTHPNPIMPLSQNHVHSLAHAFSTAPASDHYMHAQPKSLSTTPRSECYNQPLLQSSSVQYPDFYAQSPVQSDPVPPGHQIQSRAQPSDHFAKYPGETLPVVPPPYLQETLARIQRLEDDFQSMKTQLQALTLRKDPAEAPGNAHDDIFHSGLTKADIKDGIAVRSKLKDAVMFAMESVFTPEELSTCSLFGRKTSRLRIDTGSVRPALDQDRYLIIEGLLVEKFGNVADIREKVRNRLKISRGKFGNLERHENPANEN